MELSFNTQKNLFETKCGMSMVLPVGGEAALPKNELTKDAFETLRKKGAKPEYTWYKAIIEFISKKEIKVVWTDNSFKYFEVYSELLKDSFYVYLEQANQTAKPYDIDSVRSFDCLKDAGYQPEKFIFEVCIKHINDIERNIPDKTYKSVTM